MKGFMSKLLGSKKSSSAEATDQKQICNNSIVTAARGPPLSSTCRENLLVCFKYIEDTDVFELEQVSNSLYVLPSETLAAADEDINKLNHVIANSHVTSSDLRQLLSQYSVQLLSEAITEVFMSHAPLLATVGAAITGSSDSDNESSDDAVSVAMLRLIPELDRLLFSHFCGKYTQYLCVPACLPACQPC